MPERAGSDSASLWSIYGIDGSRRTWAGTRSDIDRAVREAVDAVGTWSPYGALVEARIAFESGATQRADGETFLDGLHRSDLSAITDLQVDVRPDREASSAEQERLAAEPWQGRATAGAGGGGTGLVARPETEPLAAFHVGLHFSGAPGSGLTVVVRGPSRDLAEGLHSRLMTLFARRQALRRIDIGVLVSALSIWPLVLLGLGVSHWLGWARHDNRWEWPEIVMMAVGALVAVGAGIAVYLLYPQLEIVEDGGKTRADRLAKSVAGAAAAMAVGVIASVIYTYA